MSDYSDAYLIATQFNMYLALTGGMRDVRELMENIFFNDYGSDNRDRRRLMISYLDGIWESDINMVKYCETKKREIDEKRGYKFKITRVVGCYANTPYALSKVRYGKIIEQCDNWWVDSCLDKCLTVMKHLGTFDPTITTMTDLEKFPIERAIITHCCITDAATRIVTEKKTFPSILSDIWAAMSAHRVLQTTTFEFNMKWAIEGLDWTMKKQQKLHNDPVLTLREIVHMVQVNNYMLRVVMNFGLYYKRIEIGTNSKPFVVRIQAWIRGVGARTSWISKVNAVKILQRVVRSTTSLLRRRKFMKVIYLALNVHRRSRRFKAIKIQCIFRQHCQSRAFRFKSIYLQLQASNRKVRDHLCLLENVSL